MERLENHSVIHLEGELTVASAAELKQILEEGLASGPDVQLDLERLEVMDLTALQLLWAAAKQAERAGVKLTVRASETAVEAARDAGFEPWPK